MNILSSSTRSSSTGVRSLMAVTTILLLLDAGTAFSQQPCGPIEPDDVILFSGITAYYPEGPDSSYQVGLWKGFQEPRFVRASQGTLTYRYFGADTLRVPRGARPGATVEGLPLFDVEVSVGVDTLVGTVRAFTGFTLGPPPQGAPNSCIMISFTDSVNVPQAYQAWIDGYPTNDPPHVVP